MVTAFIGSAEVCLLERRVDFSFVLFSYVEYEWPQASVTVVIVLPPDSCAADGDQQTCGGFANFDC